MCDACKKFGSFENMMGTTDGTNIAVCQDEENVTIVLFPEDGGNLLSTMSKAEARKLANLLLDATLAR